MRENFSISLWKQFQKGLSSLISAPVALYYGDCSFIASSHSRRCRCDSIRSGKIPAAKCRGSHRKAVARAARTGKRYIHKCSADEHIFAVPVSFSPEHTLVAIGNLGKHAYARMPEIMADLAEPMLKSLAAPGARLREKRGSGDAALKIFQVLEEVHQSLASVLKEEELYDVILKKAMTLAECEQGSLMMLDEAEGVLTVKALCMSKTGMASGIDEKFIRGCMVKLGQGIAGIVAKTGSAILSRDMERGANPSPLRENRPNYKTESFVSIPLKTDEKVIGVINCADKIRGQEFSDSDLRFLSSFANYASLAIERAAFYAMSEELKSLSTVDHLTDLFNRRYFMERLMEEAERAKRHKERFSVLMFDIDNFKSVNDRYGHLAGDRVLRDVAAASRNAVRVMDVVCRYGGEEFSVLLPHTGKKEAAVIAERIRKSVASLPLPENMDEMVARPTVSVGCAEFPLDARQIRTLIHCADMAMYRAKQRGKNRVVIYTASMKR